MYVESPSEFHSYDVRNENYIELNWSVKFVVLFVPGTRVGCFAYLIK